MIVCFLCFPELVYASRKASSCSELSRKLHHTSMGSRSPDRERRPSPGARETRCRYEPDPVALLDGGADTVLESQPETCECLRSCASRRWGCLSFVQKEDPAAVADSESDHCEKEEFRGEFRS